MAQKSDSRERVLAVERILSDKPQTCGKIIHRLTREYGIECSRKAVYQDIAALSRYMPVIQSAKGYFLQRTAQ